jgi:Kef-type K+ transport system membrane component KefB
MTASLYVALLLLIGLGGGWLATKANLPAVTGYILSGLILGPSVLNIITGEVYNSLAFVNELALGILAISVGTELHRDMIKKIGRDLSILSIGNTLFSFILVTGGTYLMGMPLSYASILGALSLTVSPAGVVSMIKERKAKGEMSQTLLGLVAFDNLIAILVFGFVVAFVESAGNVDVNEASLVLNVLSDVFFAGLIGLITGFFVSFFIRKELANDQLLVIIGAVILFNSGIASVLGLSPVLVNIISGATITNLTNRKVLVSQVINQMELPIFVVFLTLAGAHLDIAVFGTVGLVGLAYIICRFLGRFLGAYISSYFTSLNKKSRRNIGFGLIPQAGIAIGLATIAEQSVPGATGILTGVVLTGALAFEIGGPLLLSSALKRTGEATE